MAASPHALDRPVLDVDTSTPNIFCHRHLRISYYSRNYNVGTMEDMDQMEVVFVLRQFIAGALHTIFLMAFLLYVHIGGGILE